MTSGLTTSHLVLYFLNLAWLGAGFVEFTFRTKPALRACATPQRRKDARFASTPTGDEWHADLLIYLGAMNGAVALSVLYNILAAFKQWTPLNFCLPLWGAVHASQAIVGWARVWPSQRWVWKGQMGPITYVDTLLWVLDWLAAWTTM